VVEQSSISPFNSLINHYEPYIIYDKLSGNKRNNYYGSLIGKINVYIKNSFNNLERRHRNKLNNLNNERYLSMDYFDYIRRKHRYQKRALYRLRNKILELKNIINIHHNLLNREYNFIHSIRHLRQKVTFIFRKINMMKRKVISLRNERIINNIEMRKISNILSILEKKLQIILNN